MKFVPFVFIIALIAMLASTVLIELGGHFWIDAIKLSIVPAILGLIVLLIGFVSNIKSVGRTHEDFFDR